MQNMNQISLDMYQTLGMAVAVLFLGAFLKKRIKFLETFCIPSPVVGGLMRQEFWKYHLTKHLKMYVW